MVIAVVDLAVVRLDATTPADDDLPVLTALLSLFAKVFVLHSAAPDPSAFAIGRELIRYVVYSLMVRGSLCVCVVPVCGACVPGGDARNGRTPNRRFCCCRSCLLCAG